MACTWACVLLEKTTSSYRPNNDLCSQYSPAANRPYYSVDSFVLVPFCRFEVNKNLVHLVSSKLYPTIFFDFGGGSDISDVFPPEFHCHQ
jgi:hypothetical protein